MQMSNCPNLNHRRSNSPVRFCLQCGEVVNSSVVLKRCTDMVHAQKRQNRHIFCVDCGERLIK
jgi:hypothetical protein